MLVGQSQKEISVNEALARLDGLMFCAIEAELAVPPSAPNDGQAWLVGTGASGEWSGKSGLLALRQGGQWLYANPVDGMRVLKRDTGQEVRRAAGQWRSPAVPAQASGGSVIDVEARAMLESLVNALRQAGIFPM